MDMRGSRLIARVSLIGLWSFAATAEDAPSLEFLEFLSDWQDADGEILEARMFDDEHSAPTKPDAEVSDQHE